MQLKSRESTNGNRAARLGLLSLAWWAPGDKGASHPGPSSPAPNFPPISGVKARCLVVYGVYFNVKASRALAGYCLLWSGHIHLASAKRTICQDGIKSLSHCYRHLLIAIAIVAITIVVPTLNILNGSCSSPIGPKAASTAAESNELYQKGMLRNTTQ
jgi:hypothetical protein